MRQKVALGNHAWFKYEQVIVFDGVCNWCNFWVTFTITRDPSGKFKFGLLQSDQAKEIIDALGLSVDDFQTFLLIEQGKVYQKSTAALRVLRQLTGFWPLLYCFIVVPKTLRDGVYDFIARHRYQVFGKSESCMLPDPKQRHKFLEV